MQRQNNIVITATAALYLDILFGSEHVLATFLRTAKNLKTGANFWENAVASAEWPLCDEHYLTHDACTPV